MDPISCGQPRIRAHQMFTLKGEDSRDFRYIFGVVPVARKGVDGLKGQSRAHVPLTSLPLDERHGEPAPDP